MSLTTLSWGYPIAWVVLLALVYEAATSLRRPWARPLLFLYFTVGAWYHIDFIYNDPDTFYRDFSADVLNRSWLEVCWFLVAVRAWVHVLAPYFLRGTRVQVVQFAMTPRQELGLLQGVTGVWLVLFFFGLYRLNGDVVGVLIPPLGEWGVSPWGRASVGGATEALASVGEYTDIAVVGMFGILIALGRRTDVRLGSLFMYVLTSPVFFFDRARNKMLAILLPGLLAYLLAGRSSAVRKAAVVGLALFFIQAWFAVIIAYRNQGGTAIANTVFGGSDIFTDKAVRGTKHYGLEMYRELCCMNDLLDTGGYEVNWGTRYFAEAVAFVPRGLWSDKPFVGIDYSIARGFGGADAASGVHATMATGMIGQGVCNFGVILGPPAAAGLAAAWVCLLARLWNQRQRPTRFLLFLLGLGLTFNLGRDITLLVLFPFVFAYIAVRAAELFAAEEVVDRAPRRPALLARR